MRVVTFLVSHVVNRRRSSLLSRLRAIKQRDWLTKNQEGTTIGAAIVILRAQFTEPKNRSTESSDQRAQAGSGGLVDRFRAFRVIGSFHEPTLVKNNQFH